MLVLVLLALAVVTILAGAFVNLGFHEQRFSGRSQAGTQAFYFSESAIDDGLSWLKSQLVPPQGTQPVVPFRWQDLGGRGSYGGSYLVTIDPDDNNPNTQVKRYTIEGWGVAGPRATPLAVRRTRLTVQTESFAQYAYFTNSEKTPAGMQVWFVTGDRINGPVHTNGQLAMFGSPVFEGSVSSVAPTIRFWGNNPNSQPVFKEPPKLGVAPKEYPKVFPEQTRDAARSGGLVLKGDTAVTLLPDGTMQVTNSSAKLNNSVVPLPANGVLYVDGGTLNLKGTLKGQLTAGASGDIRVVDSVRYSDDPRLNPDSKDILGIVAGKNVVVPQEAPADLEIHGTIMAIDKSFGVENYWERPPKGKLTVYGGLIQANRGPVGTFNPGTGQKMSGYTKDYQYDPRFGRMAPPFFPTTGDYKSLVWQERKN
jgi:hypothetical protein